MPRATEKDVDDNVDTPIKQRLVGLSVLVALAAIFLPMILDGSGREGHVRVDMDIPPEPVFPAPERLPPLPSTPEPSVTTEPAEPPAQAAPEPERPPRREAVVRAAPEVEAAPVVTAEPAPPVAATGWAVQVGSFSEQARARSLGDQLKKAGFEPFIEPFSAGEGTVYRVKVGPAAERSAAETLAARLEKEQGLKGLVVSQE